MVQPCLQDHIPTGSNPENETCDTTESSDLKLCPFKSPLKAKNPQKRDTEVWVKLRENPGKEEIKYQDSAGILLERYKPLKQTNGNNIRNETNQ